MDSTKNRKPVTLTRQLTLTHAVAIIISAIIGSGIFISPKGIVQYSGSVASSLIIWVLAGVYQTGVGLCYTELGTMMPWSGGYYLYVHDTLGPLPGFLVLWTDLLTSAGGDALVVRTGSTYLLQPFFPQCNASPKLITLLSAWIIISMATLNVCSTKWSARIQIAFSTGKVGSLIIIIYFGLNQLFQGKTGSLSSGFAGSITDPRSLALAVYSGSWAYSGWHNMNHILEELENPNRNFPLAVMISMCLVMGVYIMTFVSYLTVMTPRDILDSPAVALTFGRRTMGDLVALIPLFVGMSCVGVINGSLLCASRIYYASGRLRQMPQILGMLNVYYLTPVPSIIFKTFLVLLFALIEDSQLLLDYTMLLSQYTNMAVWVTFFYLRWKHPNHPRGIKVHIVAVILVVVSNISLMVLALLKQPFVILTGVIMLVVGSILYFIGRKGIGISIFDAVTRHLQQVLLVTPTESVDINSDTK